MQFGELAELGTSNWRDTQTPVRLSGTYLQMVIIEYKWVYASVTNSFTDWEKVGNTDKWAINKKKPIITREIGHKMDLRLS